MNAISPKTFGPSASTYPTALSSKHAFPLDPPANPIGSLSTFPSVADAQSLRSSSFCYSLFPPSLTGRKGRPAINANGIATIPPKITPHLTT